MTLSLVLSGCGAKGATYDYDLSKYLTLGQYKGLEVSKEEIDTQTQAQVDNLISQSSTEESVTEGTVALNDVLNISYEGKMNGELFEGGSAENVDISVGQGTYIEGFEQGLVGKQVGETCVLNLQFPDEYEVNPAYAGAEVEFSITINSKKVITAPEYNDEFIAGLENIDYTTVADYEAAVRKGVKENLLWKYIVEGSTVIEFPEKEVKFYYDLMIKQYETLAMAQYGTSLEAFIINYMGMSYDDFLQSVMAACKDQVKKDMITHAIGKAETIKADGDDAEEIALEYALSNGFESVAAYKDAYGQAEIDRRVMLERIIQMVSAESVEI
jgi:FKBP-type peptidyl-prolyl cis-trans isomerase (trigger factor)